MFVNQILLTLTLKDADVNSVTRVKAMLLYVFSAYCELNSEHSEENNSENNWHINANK